MSSAIPPAGGGPSGDGEQPESATKTVVDAVDGARTGAQLGAKVGGAHGAAVGAAVGAGAKLLQNRRTRAIVIGLLLVVLAPTLIAPVMIGGLVGSSLYGATRNANGRAEAAAAAEGVTDVESYKLAANGTGTAWSIIAAADYSAGLWSKPGDPAFGITNLTGFNKALTEAGVPPLADLNDRLKVGYAWGRLLTAYVRAANSNVDPSAVDVGSGTISDPNDPDRTVRALNTSNPDAVKAHEAAKAAFTAALGKIPTSTRSDAPRIFDTALRWMLATDLRTGSTDCAPAGPVGPPVSVEGYSAEQMANITTAVSVGRQLGLSERAWQIAIMTMLVESEARNLDHGHADSLGLYQQRPSSGWGTREQIMDPVAATKAFYGMADHTPNPGLVDIKGWEQMTMGDAAQKVQASAFPTKYAEREAEARALLEKVAGSAAAVNAGSAGTGNCPPAGLGAFANCPPTPWPDLESPPQLGGQIPPDALRTLRCGHQQFPQFTSVITYGERSIAADEHGTGRAVDWMVPGGWQNPAGRAVSLQMANWLVANAKPLGVEYVIWDNMIWNSKRDPAVAVFPQGWRPYAQCSPPKGTAESCGPTAAHQDHVHVTLYGNAGVVSGAGGGWQAPFTTPFQLGPGICIDSSACWGYSSHTGQDFGAPENTPVVAAAGGTISTAKVLCPDLTNAQRRGNKGCSYGRFVIIEHGDGVATLYAHLNDFGPGITEGATVAAGQVIGFEGSQGNSSGPHLHFEVRLKGAYLNPITYLEQQGVPIRCTPLMTASYGNVPAGKC